MRNLLGRLLDRSPQSLAAIARYWEIELRGRDEHQDVGQVYRVLSDPWAFALVWQRLGPTERAILDLLGSDESALTAEEIAAHLSAGEDRILPELRGLYRAGLLFQEESPDPEAPRRFFVPREMAYLTSRIHAERERGLPTAAAPDDLLDRLDDGELAGIAEHFGYRVIPAMALRPDLVAFVAPRLTDPDRIRDAIRSLDPTASRLWTWLSTQSEPVDPAASQAALGAVTGEFRLALKSLARRGLLWRGWDQDGSLRLVVPEIIRRPRRAPAPPPPPLVEVASSDVQPVEWIQPFAAAWDLLTFLRGLASERIRWQRDAGSERNAAALRRLAPRLWRRSGDLPPTGYVGFLAYLATAEGLIHADDSGVDTGSLRVWTRMTFPEQTRRLAELWRNSSEWAEGRSREVLQVWGADWSGFRERLLASLGELEPGRWYTLESFSAQFAAVSPGALGAQFTAAASHEPSEETPDERRRRIVRLAAGITLETACAWLGIVEVSRAPRRGTVFQVTSLGAWLISAGAALPEEPELGAHPLVVQPNFEVLLLRPAPTRVWALSAFTDLGQLDRVTIYRLTRESIERGMASGLSLQRISRFLEEAAGEPLPQNVAYQIGEWAREYRRVRLRPALVVEPDDRSATAGIERALRDAELRVERIGGDRLLISLPAGDDDAALAKVEAILRGLGQTPQWLPGHSGVRREQ